MPKIPIPGAVFATALALGISVAAPAASDAEPTPPYTQRCAETLGEPGTFELMNGEGACVNKTGGKFIRVEEGGTVIGPGEECAHVVQKETGSFEDSACKEEKSKEEWIRVKPEKRQINSTSGFATLVTVTGEEIICEKDSAKAEISAPERAAKAAITFTGKCHSVIGGIECHSTEPEVAPEGTIKTFPLKGRLAYIKKEAPTEVGMAFEPEAGTKVAKFVCGFFSKEVTGKMIGVIPATNAKEEAQYNKMRSTYELKFRQKTGHQEPEAFEGGVKEVLFANGTQAGIETVEMFTMEEPLELTA
jgi:hypothetical protein